MGRTAAGLAGGGRVMSGMRAFRSVFASVIFVALTAAPAYSWHGSGSISALAIDSKTPTTLYAVTCDRGVFKSTDGGASWNATGLTGVGVLALAIDPQTPTILYAGGTPNRSEEHTSELQSRLHLVCRL